MKIFQIFLYLAHLYRLDYLKLQTWAGFLTLFPVKESFSFLPGVCLTENRRIMDSPSQLDSVPPAASKFGEIKTA